MQGRQEASPLQALWSATGYQTIFEQESRPGRGRACAWLAIHAGRCPCLAGRGAGRVRLYLRRERLQSTARFVALAVVGSFDPMCGRPELLHGKRNWSTETGSCRRLKGKLKYEAGNSSARGETERRGAETLVSGQKTPFSGWETQFSDQKLQFPDRALQFSGRKLGFPDGKSPFYQRKWSSPGHRGVSCLRRGVSRAQT